VTRHAVRLAGDLPVVHDISAGGLAVALAEVCIRSGVGAVVGNGDWPLMLDETPHRFLAVVPAGSDLGIHDVPVRRLGTMGGDRIDFGRHGSVGLSEAIAVWRNAIPRRMHG
jgi:phosphoribosylformylglycinamidine synthase